MNKNNKSDYSLNRWEAIFFDFDGVLVESVEVKTRAFSKLFEPYGESVVSKVVNYHLNNGGVSRYDKFCYFYDHFLQKPITTDIIENLDKEFSNMVVQEVLSAPYVNGAESFLNKYYKKIPMFVISGTPYHELKDIIKRREMAHYFMDIFGSPGEKGDYAKEIINHYGYDKNNILFIGDALSDYKGACDACVQFIGRVPYKQNNPFPEHVAVFRDFKSLHNDWK